MAFSTDSYFHGFLFVFVSLYIWKHIKSDADADADEVALDLPWHLINHNFPSRLVQNYKEGDEEICIL